MGGGASIESTNIHVTNGLDKFEALKSSGIKLSTDYETIKGKYSKTKSISTGNIDKKQDGKNNTNDLATIHFLAIRQLSHNLQNQDILQKNQKKIMTKSLPNIQHFLHEEYPEAFNPNILINEELGPEDLLLVHDDDYNEIPYNQNVSSIHDSKFSSGMIETSTAQTPKPKVKKAKPNLSLQIYTTMESPTLFPHENVSIDKHVPQSLDQNNIQQYSQYSNVDLHHNNNSTGMYLSPEGTLYMGKLKVMETGIYPATNKSFNASNRPLQSSTGGSGSFRKQPLTTSMKQVPVALGGGKRDFIEINALGNGASGVVTEAIHLPSLTIVALKMLPVYNQEKRQHVSRELEVLYKNLSELQLVDDRLYTECKSEKDEHTTGLGSTNSPHIVSLYNAFVDPRSGLINLVIEYMDGGSLEDLVKQGGCADERVLADIAYQACKGLCFLHANKNVHRDIKPANILCSTSGLIKIADFGVAKALDKTTGFANSFIGTVCYMSPERIIGDSPYSFPCDIWSLGLTLLAVATGRFPLPVKEERSNSKSETNNDVITSDTSVLKSPQIVGGAIGYWAMIKAICDDDPPSPGRLFSKEFNDFIAVCLHKEPSERLTAKELLQLPFIEQNVASIKLSHSDLQTKYSKIHKMHENDQTNKSSTQALYVDTQSTIHDKILEFAPQSPLTNRLRKASITSNTTSQDSSDEFALAASVYSVRVAHLERVLDRILRKIEQCGSTYKDNSNNYDENDDTDDHDIADVFAYVAEDVLLLPNHHHKLVHQVTDTSIDSLDNMLNYNKSTSMSANHSVQSKDAIDDSNEDQNNKFLFKKYSFEFENNNNHDSKQSLKKVVDDETNNETTNPNPLYDTTDTTTVLAESKQSATQSILKGSNSYNNEHIFSDLDDIGEPSDLLHHHNTVINSINRSKAVTAVLSITNRSVHFSDTEDNNHSPLPTSFKHHSNIKNVITTSDDQHKHSEHSDIVEVVINENSTISFSSSSVSSPLLPRSSSYFIQTSSKDRIEAEPSNNSHVPQQLSGLLIVNTKEDDNNMHPFTSSYDYRDVIPKLDRKGLRKWDNLAKQLHLPLSMVKLAVRSKLGLIMNLEEEEDLN